MLCILATEEKFSNEILYIGVTVRARMDEMERMVVTGYQEGMVKISHPWSY